MMDEVCADLIKGMGEDKDPEVSHKNADEILCEIAEASGFPKTVEAFNDLIKWYE